MARLHGRGATSGRQAGDRGALGEAQQGYLRVLKLMRGAWHDPVWSKVIASFIGVVFLASLGFLWSYSAELKPQILNYLHASVTTVRWQLWLGAFLLLFVGAFAGRAASRKLRSVGGVEPAASPAGLADRRPARAARPFFFGGLCWRIQPSFFDSYEILDRPTGGDIGPHIFGPLCPQCGQLRHRRVEPADMYDQPRDVMTPLCLTQGCEHQLEFGFFRGGLSYDEAKLDVYKAAQALALKGEPFPPGPCVKFDAMA